MQDMVVHSAFSVQVKPHTGSEQPQSLLLIYAPEYTYMAGAAELEHSALGKRTDVMILIHW